MSSVTFSIVVLTYNRPHLLSPLAAEMKRFSDAGAEVIVVDNCSEPPASNVTDKYPWVMTIRAPRNLGAAGRNLGFAAATGDIIICLDDDVTSLSADALDHLPEIFRDPTIAGVNFKVLNARNGAIANWVHHREVEVYGERSFDTYEITEGAVAFRRNAVLEVGGYPESFFLSHEGPDLAFRLMNRGRRVTYTPLITVSHSFAGEGRASWRNYYFDTRNTLWLVARNLPLAYGLRVAARQTLAMLVYAARDGYVNWWFRGLRDGLRGLAREAKARESLTPEAMRRVREIDRARPSILYVLRRRLPRRGLNF